MRTWLADIRKTNGLSQAAVAAAAGISQSYYACIELGTRGKPLAVPLAKKLGKVLNFPWTRFYDEDEETA